MRTFFPPILYLLSTYCVPDSTFDAWDVIVNKMDKNLFPHGVYILVEAVDSRQHEFMIYVKDRNGDMVVEIVHRVVKRGDF